MFDSVSKLDHFQLLGVKPDTPPEQVTLAFRSLAKKWHRDAYGSLPLGPQKDKLDDIFSKISAAHETLITPEKRSEYMVFIKRKNAGMVTDVTAVFQAEELYDSALAAIRKKQFVEARKSLEDAIKLNKDEPLYHMSLGWALFKMEPKLNFRAALDSINRALQIRENLAEAYYYLGEMYIAQEDNSEAMKNFKRCARLDPKHIEAARRVRLLNQRDEQKKKSGGLGGFLNKLLKK